MDYLINPKQVACVYDWEFKLCSTGNFILFSTEGSQIFVIVHNCAHFVEFCLH